MGRTIIFRELAREWWERYLAQGAKHYADESWRYMEREAFPYIGDMEVQNITPHDVLDILRRIEKRGHQVKARKLKSHISQTLRYGIALGYLLTNPARDLTWALMPHKTTPRAAYTDHTDISNLMCDIEDIASVQRRLSLKLLAYTFVRPGEMCSAAWSEISFEERLWRIPAEKMKMKRPHVVPLSKQVIEMLRDLHRITGNTPWLFPSRWDKNKHELANVYAIQLRKMPCAGKMVPHGFRAMAATTMSDAGWSSEVIEFQLAHKDQNATRAAYQRSERLGERKQLMQAWADFLDLRTAQGILEQRRKAA